AVVKVHFLSQPVRQMAPNVLVKVRKLVVLPLRRALCEPTPARFLGAPVFRLWRGRRGVHVGSTLCQRLAAGVIARLALSRWPTTCFAPPAGRSAGTHAHRRLRLCASAAHAVLRRTCAAHVAHRRRHITLRRWRGHLAHVAIHWRGGRGFCPFFLSGRVPFYVFPGFFPVCAPGLFPFVVSR